MEEYSVDALISYLEFRATNSTEAERTIRNRISAVKAIFRYANEREKQDVRSVSIIELADRLAEPKKVDGQRRIISPRSIKLYKARCRRALSDYLDFKEGDNNLRVQSSLPVHAVGIPIMIRDDWIVKITNLPLNLTEDEARKIANLVIAYAGGTAFQIKGEN